jgi:hypothetical protein
MKCFGHYAALAVAGLVLIGEISFGQTTNQAPKPPGSDTPTVPTVDATASRNTSGRILLPQPPADASQPTVDAFLGVRPDRPERSLAPEVREQLNRFRDAREKYLEDQAKLEKLLKGATEKEREEIRKRIKESHDKWLRQHRAFRDEANQRMRELKRTLPKHGAAINEVRPGQRGRQPAGLD